MSIWRNVRLNMETFDLYLASASPRREELLRTLGLNFITCPVDADESIFDHESVSKRVELLAVHKAKLAAQQYGIQSGWIIGADTLVEIPAETNTSPIILGKPADYNEAKAMLIQLSGRMHLVWTGIAIINVTENSVHTTVNRTEVYFTQMSPAMIDAYLATNEWKGVAAAYRIQGKGGCFIHHIKGSYSCIMGLPICDFYGILVQSGYPSMEQWGNAAQ